MWETLKAVRWLSVLAVLYAVAALVLVMTGSTAEALVVAVIGVSMSVLATIRS